MDGRRRQEVEECCNAISTDGTDSTLVSNIDLTTARTGHWIADEDKQLEDAVGTQGCNLPRYFLVER
jgi:hypothetical protein